MTKTQKRLIERANSRGGIYSVETYSGKGPKGGRINRGNRERDALFALEKSGAVRITSRQTINEWTGNGNMVHGTLYTFHVA